MRELVNKSTKTHILDVLNSAKNILLALIVLFSIGSTPIVDSGSKVSAASYALAKPVIYAQRVTYNRLKVTVRYDIEGATSFKYYRSTKKSGDYKLVKTSSSRYYYDRGLQTDTRYYYKVIAYGSGSKRSSASDPRSAKPTLNKITNINRYLKLRTVKLLWTDIPGASGYKVYRATSKSANYHHIANVSKRTYTNSGLNHNEDYYYKIKPFRRLSTKVVYGSVTSARRAVTPLPEGVYKIKVGGLFKLQTNGSAYYSSCYYSTCDWGNDYDDNDYFRNTAYVWIGDGDYVDFDTFGKKGSLKRVSKGGNWAYGYFDDSIPYKNEIKKSGHYWVGVDIEPGEYKITSPGDFYWSACDNTPCDWSAGDNDIVTNGTAYVRIDSGFLKINSYGDPVRAVRVSN